MLQKTRDDHTGIELEVNERILDACTDLMKVNIKIFTLKEMDIHPVDILFESISF